MLDNLPNGYRSNEPVKNESALWAELYMRMQHATVVDRAVQATMREYQRALDEYLVLVVPYGSIRSIYQVGSITVGGLSDIDLLVIMSDSKRELCDRYAIRYLSDRSRYLFSHDPILMDDISFRSLAYWFPYFHLRHIWGEQMSTERNERRAILKLIFLVNQLMVKIPYEFISLSCRNGYYWERTMVAMLHSLTYSLRLWGEAVGTSNPSHWQRFVADYAAFRTGYFDQPEDLRSQKLRDFTLRAIGLAFELIDSVDLLLREKYFREFNAGDILRFRTDYLNYVFDRHWDSDHALRELLDHDKVPTARFPLTFAGLLSLYGRGDGLVGRHVRESLRGDLKVQVTQDVEESFMQHTNAVEHVALFHARKFHTPIHGYFTYWAPHTFSKSSWCIDKIVNRMSRIVR